MPHEIIKKLITTHITETEIGVFANGTKFLFEKKGDTLRVFLNDSLIIQQETMFGRNTITLNASLFQSLANKGLTNFT
jgi:hypothetical protein